MKSPLEKLNEMAQGEIVICSDSDLDSMAVFDRSNLIRSRPNPARVGMKDRWECWIEQRDINHLNP